MPWDGVFQEVWGGHIRESIPGVPVGASGSPRRDGGNELPKPSRYRCLSCGRPFDDPCRLGRHLQAAHGRTYPDGAEAISGRSCGICHASIGDEAELLRHYSRAHVGVCPADGDRLIAHKRCDACCCLIGEQHESMHLVELHMDSGQIAHVCSDCGDMWRRQVVCVGMTWDEWIGRRPPRLRVRERIAAIRAEFNLSQWLEMLQ